MDDRRTPQSVEDGLRVAAKLVGALEAEGISRDDIFLDPLIKPLSVGDQRHRVPRQCAAFKHEYPDVHLICGLSNISFGLPKRRLLNRTFPAMGMAAGMDAFILDALDTALMATFFCRGRSFGGPGRILHELHHGDQGRYHNRPNGRTF